MKVKSKSSNRFFIKDEWYEVTSINDVDNGGYPHTEEYKESTPGRSIHYELKNHTDKIWSSNWHSEINFYTLKELRDIKLDLILD